MFLKYVFLLQKKRNLYAKQNLDELEMQLIVISVVRLDRGKCLIFQRCYYNNYVATKVLNLSGFCEFACCEAGLYC